MLSTSSTCDGIATTRHDTSRYECEQDSLMGRPNSSSLVTEASEAMAQEHGLRCAAEGTARSVGCESLAASKHM